MARAFNLRRAAPRLKAGARPVRYVSRRGEFPGSLRPLLSGRTGPSHGPRIDLRTREGCAILNHMVQFSSAHLDASFAALADPTRRGILERLGRADASITELAGTFRMTLTGMRKHIGVLEQTGLVMTAKAGRVRTCTLGPRRLEEAASWIERYRQLWDARFDELDQLVEELQRTREG